MRSLLTRRWLGAAGLVVTVLLVASLAAFATTAGPTPDGGTLLPAVIALLATVAVVALGAAAAGLRRTPYW